MSDALLAGASGLIGREVLRQWAGPGTLHCLLRKPQAVAPHTQVLVVDYAALPKLPAATSALCCLGTTIKTAGSQAAFRAVDFDAVIAFAQAAQRAGVQRFAVVSALGANAKSGNFYSRVKGEMEAALMALGFKTLVIARPSLLAGDRAALGQPLRRGLLRPPQQAVQGAGAGPLAKHFTADQAAGAGEQGVAHAGIVRFAQVRALADCRHRTPALDWQPCTPNRTNSSPASAPAPPVAT